MKIVTPAPRPYCSKLQPFEAEIAAMRQKRPPTPYREIVKILKERHGLTVQLSTLANFVKVRSKAKRSSYLFGPPWHRANSLLSQPPKKPSTPNPSHQSTTNTVPQARQAPSAPSPPRRRVSFAFSEQYNLTRLTKEEVAELERKLDEQLKGQP